MPLRHGRPAHTGMMSNHAMADSPMPGVTSHHLITDAPMPGYVPSCHGRHTHWDDVPPHHGRLSHARITPYHVMEDLPTLGWLFIPSWQMHPCRDDVPSCRSRLACRDDVQSCIGRFANSGDDILSHHGRLGWLSAISLTRVLTCGFNQ